MEIKPEAKLQVASLDNLEKADKPTVLESNEVARIKEEAEKQEILQETSSNSANEKKEETQEEIKEYLER